MLGMVAVCVLTAMANWRFGIFLTIVVDALRDPIRKLTPGQPVWISQIIVVVWAIVFISCLSKNARVLREVQKVFPRLRTGTFFFVVALIPGAFLAVILSVLLS